MGVTLEQLEDAVLNAIDAGDMDAARKLDAMADRERERQPEGIMGAWSKREGFDQIAPETVIPEAPPTLGENITGAVETGAALGTGMTGGLVGGIAGALEGLAQEIIAGKFGQYDAAERISEKSQERAAQLTRAPTTERGQEMLQGVGKAIEPLSALAPAAIGVTGTMGTAARQAATGVAPMVRAGAVAAGSKVAPMVDRAIDKTKEIKSAIIPGSAPEQAIDTGPKSMGAAQVDAAARRIQEAEDLPVPIRLTRGEATLDPDIQKEEDILSKMGEIGAPLRERKVETNLRLQQNLDQMVDDSGATLSSALKEELGEAIVKPIEKEAARSRVKINAWYRRAKKKGGMSEKVEMKNVAGYLNGNSALRGEENILGKVDRQITEVMKIGTGSIKDQSLRINKMKLHQAEDLRRFINLNLKKSDDSELRVGRQIMKLIDQNTEGKGSNLYRRARKEREEHGKTFENVALVRDLLATKPGLTERLVAVEKVMERILSASNAQTAHLKKVLNASGPEGQQAWKEVEGGTFEHIKNKALRSVTQTAGGDRSFSASGLERALAPMMESGKLNTIFDKKTVQNLSILMDVARNARTNVEGALINRSGTAGTVAAIIDLVFAGSTQIPVPVATVIKKGLEKIQDKKLKAKVAEALRENQKQKPAL